MGDWPELERRLDALYVSVRDGTVDRQAAFDIAMNELEYSPRNVRARELAEASVTDGDEAGLALAARAFLDARGYEPGFDQAPERFARLERALDAVRADLRATGLAGEVRLVRPDWSPRNVVVETWAGDQGWSSGIFPSDAADDLSALIAGGLVRKEWAGGGRGGPAGLAAQHPGGGGHAAEVDAEEEGYRYGHQ